MFQTAVNRRFKASIISTTSNSIKLSLKRSKVASFSTRSKPSSLNKSSINASSHFSDSNLHHITPYTPTRLFFSKKCKYYAPVPTALLGWSFTNSETFDSQLEKQLQEADSKLQKQPDAPIIEKVYSSQDGLQTESFSSWIRAILAQAGHFGSTDLPLDEINQYSSHHDDIDYELDRSGIIPDTYLWCKTDLNKIFRFSTEDTLGLDYSIKVPTTADVEKLGDFPSAESFYDELIKYKTFVEKERYKFLRAYEEVLEMEANLGQSLDQLNVMLAHANPYDSEGHRFESEILAPIYKSVFDSLISVAEMSTVLDKPILVMSHHDRAVQNVFNQFEAFRVGLPPNQNEWTPEQKSEFLSHQKGAYSKALYILRQQGIAIQHAGQLINGMQQLMDEVSWQFKSFYDPITFERIIGYAKEEANKDIEQRDNFFASINKLPIPPLLSLSAISLLNHFVAVPQLSEIAEKLKQDGGNQPDFDPNNITLVSQPLQLFLLLVDANDKTKRLTPTVHDRASVFETATEMCKTLRTRPYVIWGIHQRLLEIKKNKNSSPEVAKPQAITDLHQFYQQPGDFSSSKHKRKHKKSKRKRSPKTHPNPEDTILLEDHSETPAQIIHHIEEVSRPAVLDLPPHPHIHDKHDDI